MAKKQSKVKTSGTSKASTTAGKASRQTSASKASKKTVAAKKATSKRADPKKEKPQKRATKSKENLDLMARFNEIKDQLTESQIRDFKTVYKFFGLEI